ncbi:MAG: pitrilysin family protein [Pseudomonadota bacterium]|nr:pitrilysin family protein [Pseudomonadota bacterium]
MTNIKVSITITLKIIFLFSIFFLLFTTSFSATVKFSDRIEEYVLPNNLKVILLEDKRNPIIISSIWYKVGSSYEEKGITGISHILEHMMFKGTEKTKSGEFSKIIKKLGGSENAFTGRDFTGYYQKVHKKYIEKCLEMESDRMTNLILREDDFQKELNVVKEERRLRVEDRPISKAFEKTLIQLFGYNGYGVPIVGTMDDLDNVKISDVKNWYDNFYSPDNAILILAGDFEKSNIKKLIDKYFSKIKNSKTTLKFKNNELNNLNFKKIELKESISNPTVLISFVQPKFNKNDRLEHYKMELLLELMDGGNSSRFTRNLVDKKKIAIETFISFDTYPINKNIISIGGIPRTDISTEELKNEILLQFQNIEQEGISDREFESLKSRLIASNTFKFDSLFGQVMSIGVLESKGIGWNTLDYYLDDINKITKNDLIDIAKKYFINKSFIYTVIYPKES